MKILTEYVDKDVPATLTASLTKFTTLKDIKPGEAVGIYLKDLKPCTKRLIEELLTGYTKKELRKIKDKWVEEKIVYKPHPVTLKLGDKQAKLYRYEDWAETHQDPNDQIKMVTERHWIHEEFLRVARERREKKDAFVKMKQYRIIFENFELPSEEEIDKLLQDLAPLYEVDVDYTDNLSRYRAYVQIKYYLEHDFEYSKPANAAFIMPIGNENYLEDLIYKEGSKDEEVYV